MRYFCLLALMTLPLSAETITKGERDQAMSHLHATRKQILDLIGPLSDAQWTYKPGPDRWSIAECAEHIAETEVALRGLILQRVKTLPVDEAKRAARAAAKDASAKGVITTMTDRSKRYSAPSEIRPTGRFATKAALIEAFTKRRDETIAYVEKTEDDLRGRVARSGLSDMDLYETVLMISAHSERHMLQMKEVQASPGYPKQ